MQYRPGREHMNADCFFQGCHCLIKKKVSDPEDRVLMIEELEDCCVLSAKKISEWTRKA